MRNLMVFPLLVMLSGVGLGNGAAYADVSADFHKACLARGGSEALCACKTAMATKIADTKMLQYVILSMSQPEKFTAMEQKHQIPEDVMAKWGTYVSQSNAKCAPGN
jgi:hypothetical protein